MSGPIINSEERAKLREFITQQFSSLPWIANVNLPVIGIGGSARNIAQVHQQKMNYPLSGVHEYEMQRADLGQLRDYLTKYSFEQLKQLDGLSSDRADTIVLALEVFIALLSVVGSSTFQVSKKGLREGLIISRVLQENSNAYNKYNVFEESARQLAFAYGRTEQEVRKLAELAEQFYRECCRLQLFDSNEEDLELLIKAAKVYAIGEYIELDSSSQHTFYLIANQSLPGLSHINRVKLALLASYKNRDYFERFAQPFTSWISKEELKKLRDFGAVLKFVYALNMTKRNVVKNITIEELADGLQIQVVTAERAIAEMAQVEKQKKHIERAFKKNIQLVFNEEGWKL